MKSNSLSLQIDCETLASSLVSVLTLKGTAERFMTQGLLDAIESPAIVISSEGRLTISNKGARKLFGDAIIGRHYITVLRQPSLLDAIEKVQSSGKLAPAWETMLLLKLD